MELPHSEAAADDEGFTLVEVVVALGLLGIIATSALGFFISGMRTSTDLQRRQVAVALANAAVEDARALPVTMQTTTPAGGQATSWPLLVQGRTKTVVDAQWAAAPASLTSATFPAWDPQTTPGALLLGTSKTDAVGTARYTTTTYVGTCYRLRSTADQACGRASGTRSASPPAGYEELVRISAVTSWGTATECSGASCSYTASLLVDTSTDPQWNNRGGQAVDDVATVTVGTTTSLDVLSNDTMIPASSSPVTLGAVPAGISASADSSGSVTVTVPAGTSPGTKTLTYTVRDAYGATSNTATIRITVTS